LQDNTIVIFTSDHGWGMGEKDYLYKNSLWQESTRIPLVIRAPGVSKRGLAPEVPVSLIDLYPTLLDLCGLPDDTTKSDKGHPLDGFSLRPLLEGKEAWDGPEAALTALFEWADYYDPAHQSYSLRYRDWRYIRYETGQEELYHTAQDPHEWVNLALHPDSAEKLADCRADLDAIIPESKPRPTQTAEGWKEEYFRKHPAADANGDGNLSWPEYQAHKKQPKKGTTQKSPPGKRLQTEGTFSTGETGWIFTDNAEGSQYFIIDPLRKTVSPHLDQTVRVVARVKPTKSGKAKLIVHIVSIKPAN
jgi:iduronate 2-sulfatase